MIALCLDNSHYPKELTVGKYYDVSETSSPIYYSLIDDCGSERRCLFRRFKLISDIREEKLNELGI